MKPARYNYYTGGKKIPREDDYSVPYVVAVIKARSYTGERARAKTTVLVMGTG